jgi:3'(2'), 5'-bisphosphate nucleotidase
MVDAADSSHGYDPAHPDGLIFWTLDPIDGTKGFLRGGQYAVSLAWLEDGEPVLATLGCPNLASDFQRPFDEPDPRGTIYFATRGGGVWEGPADDPEAHPIHIRRLEPEEGEPIRVCESVEKAHSDQSATARILEHLGRSSRDLRLDSQAKYAVVARGQADAYLRMPTKKGYIEKIWDHAAGALIASEAGCFVTDILGNRLDFRHGQGLEKNLGVVCAPAALHGELIGAIADLEMDRGPEDRS